MQTMTAMSKTLPAFSANTFTAGFQGWSDIAAMPDGRYVVTWASWLQDGNGNGVIAQIFNADGTPSGSEFVVNTFTTGSQQLPKIEVLANGDFVIVWEAYGPEGPFNAGIYGQRFDSTGTPLGAEFGVNTVTADHQKNPAITALSDGGFVVTWQSSGQETGTNAAEGIYAQRYDAGGVAVGGEIHVNTYTPGVQRNADVTALEGGGYVVMWQSAGQDGNLDGIFGQIYGADGLPSGTEFSVNSYTFQNQYGVKVTALADGGFVATWSSYGEDGNGAGVISQQFDAAGAKVGAAFQVNTYTTNNQSNSAVAALADGGYVIVWSSWLQDGDGYGTYAQRFDASGAKVGGEERVNTATVGYQDRVSITDTADGGFIISWTSADYNPDPGDVFVQQYDAQLFGTAADDVMSDDVGANWMIGQDGNDKLYGLTGDDVLEGGLGNDVLDGGVGVDTASYASAIGGVEVYLNANKSRGADGYDRLYNIENVIGSDFNDRLIGDAGDNVLSGGAGDDILKGKGGNDTYFGGTGNDTIRGDAGIDTMYGEEGSDTLLGLSGNDILDGGLGNDALYGGRDDDVLNGGEGDDRLRGNLGNDTLNGDAGSDDLRGGGGDDVLNGGAGKDWLYGQTGADTLNGGAGNDVLSGGGADGAVDTFVFAAGYGDDRVRGFEDGLDQIDLTGYGFVDAAEALSYASQTSWGAVKFDLSGAAGGQAGDVLYIEGMTLGTTFTAADFIF